MSQDLAATQEQYSDLSLKKQKVYRRYANGELTWLQVAEGIEGIKPPPPNLSPKQKIALYLSTFLLSVLIPPWAKRED
jgi:hypothetical protein